MSDDTPDTPSGGSAFGFGVPSEPSPGVDLSGLHRELDRLKSSLCRCQHRGECMACKGFEVVRQQAQAVAAAASQPVLMQVAQEASMKDMMSQLGGLQEKLQSDPQLAELMARMAERVQEDLGGPEELEKMLRSMGFMGLGGESGPAAPEDRPMGFRPKPPTDKPGDSPPGDDKPSDDDASSR